MYLSHAKWASEIVSEGAEDKVKAGTYTALYVPAQTQDISQVRLSG